MRISETLKHDNPMNMVTSAYWTRTDYGVTLLVPAVTAKIDLQRSGQFSRTVVESVVSSGKPVAAVDTESHPALAGVASLRGQEIRSLLAAPLMRKGRPFGVIYLDSQTTGIGFGADQIPLIEEAAAHVTLALDNSRERRALKRRTSDLEALIHSEVERHHDISRIVGACPAMQTVLANVRRVAVQDTAVLVLGESGTGKELIARALHGESHRRSGPFVPVNCMALPSDLVESELFGHERGSFTGAAERNLGRFELARGGTLFLDEIGELDLRVQVKLLRVIEEGVIHRVGSGSPVPVDIRLVYATNADLQKAVAAGTFREDLFFRISVFPITLPPLRERQDDIGPLCQQLIRQLAPRMGRKITELDQVALDALRRYHWPGNIRELRNVLERALVLEETDRITLRSLPVLAPTEFAPPEPSTRGATQTLAASRDAFERQFILRCLERHGRNISAAARELAIPRSTIYRKLQEWGIETGLDSRPESPVPD